MIMALLYLFIPVSLFVINELYNNKIVIFMTKFYKCCKLIIAIVPIIAIVFNKDLRKKIFDKFKNMDKKDINNIIKINDIQKTNKPKFKRNVSESKKKYVASNQQWKCKKCQTILDATYEVDHVMPLYKGGNNEVYNLEALCRNCHGKKTLLDRIN